MNDTVVNLPAAQPPRREIQTVVDPVPILDTARFEHMQRIASVMARSSMIPESLRTFGRGDDKKDLPYEQVLSNCFLVVNQAARWGMDPFAVISCCAVVHGRLSYEGKLVAAVLDAKLGIELHHHFTGEPASEAFRIYLSDQPFTDEIIAQLKPGFSKTGWKIIDGSVAEWKTTGAGTPWTVKNYKRMLIYRGTRDWGRIFKPAIMLGVYSDDEMLDLMEDARARRAVPVASSLQDRLAAAKALSTPAADGFSRDHVERESRAGAIEESITSNGAANHSETPHDATLEKPQASDHTTVGAETDQTGEKPVTESSSASTTLPPNQDALPERPATDEAAPSDVAGQLDTSADPSPGAEGAGGDGGGDAAPSPQLPQGWEITYAAALRRAQKKESLAKYASQFWAQYGGWAAHKSTEHGATAVAIFDAFTNHFGNKDAIEAQLRELL